MTKQIFMLLILLCLWIIIFLAQGVQPTYHNMQLPFNTELKLPPGFYDSCTQAILTNKIVPINQYTHQLARLVCEESYQANISPDYIAAILTTETRWILQNKPSVTSDYGPMQINWIHIGTTCPKTVMTDLKMNIQCGIKIFKMCKQRFSCYNGDSTGAYHKRTFKFQQKFTNLKDIYNAI